MNQVYALMVGIDEYLPPVPPLDGCVNDMRAMKNYLKRSTQATATPLHLVVLENSDATRQNVITQFQTHLSQAREGDAAIFYFSGHGSQEHAHEIFWPLEPDKKNETLVCYDSRSAQGLDLADKEIATLLESVAQHGAHVVVVMDCCNSGSGTRGMSKVRNVNETAPIRGLDTYLLPQAFQEKLKANHGAELPSLDIPKARHIALSAAHSFQLAKETWLGGSPRGVFTYSLLETLERNVGPISYYDLMRRVQTLVGQRTFDQTPQIYSREQNDLDLSFLNGGTNVDFRYNLLSFDSKLGWSVDAGAIHGMVGSGAKGERTVLEVYAEDAPPSEMMDPEMRLGKVTVVSVSPERSLVELEAGLWLHKRTFYRCRLLSLAQKKISIFLQGDERASSLVKHAYEGESEARQHLELVEKPELADYRVIGSEKEEKEEYFLVRKSDADTQPLVEQVAGFLPASAKTIVEQLTHISRWEALLALENPASSIPNGAVIIEILPKAQDQPPIQPESDGYVFRYQHTPDKKHWPRIRVRVRNTSGRRLYCSLIHMTSLFGIDPSYLDDAGVWLGPEEEAYVAGNRAFRLSVKDEIYQTGRKEVTEIFKLMVSTNEFDANRFAQKSLNAPKTRDVGRSIGGEGRSPIEDNDWNATHLSLRIIREN